MTSTQRPMGSPDGRIVFLDALRIFAFASVLVGHKFYGLLELAVPAQPGPRQNIANFLMELVRGGGAGVVTFFLVSGYIITHVLQSEPTAEFLVKRAFRIYPLYLAALFIQTAGNYTSGKPIEPGVLLPQLLLIGDFFGTQYALSGVEWTLRVEIVFYLVMAGIYQFRAYASFTRYLPYLLLALVPLTALVGPFPSGGKVTVGYFTIYFPFLLVGSLFYLFERGQAHVVMLAGTIAVVLAQYYWLIFMWQPYWSDSYFAPQALFVFFAGWALRGSLRKTAWLLFLSDLTFSVYLFHYWMFDYLKSGLLMLGLPDLEAHMLSLPLLLGVCYFAVLAVERPGVRLGKKAAAALRRTRQPKDSSKPVRS